MVDRVFDGGDIAVDFVQGGPRLAITFTSYEPSGGASAGRWAGTVQRLGLSGLYFISKRNHWFNSTELPQAIEAANKIRARFHSANLVAASMGAHAAIRLADRLSADVVVAVSPQYCIRRSLVPFESRWQNCLKNIEQFDLPISETTHSCPIHVIFDDNIVEDLRHAELIKEWTGAHLVPMRYSGHSSAMALADLGLLDKLFDFSGDPDKDKEVLRRMRMVYEDQSDRSASVLSNRLSSLSKKEQRRMVNTLPEGIIGIRKSKERLNALVERIEAVDCEDHAERLPRRSTAKRIGSEFKRLWATWRRN